MAIVNILQVLKLALFLIVLLLYNLANNRGYTSSVTRLILLFAFLYDSKLLLGLLDLRPVLVDDLRVSKRAAKSAR